mmetsp:Transcript_3732/g.6271  ORF Transcript_3732/g.6271 Transcript_3732/m.6271 type:complete len:567 (-) Transcript_3732:124-1824(-)
MSHIAGGDLHSLLLLEDGEVFAFGGNDEGQCTVPAAVRGRRATQVAAGASYSVVLLEDGDVVAFGSNDHGQCSIPANLRGQRATQVAAGAWHMLILLESGELVAFGNNAEGQCDIPAAVRAMRATKVAAGANHSLVVLENGELVVFGANDMGQCTIPARVQGNRVKEVDGGWGHSVVLLEHGEVVAFGQTGNGICDVPAEAQGQRAVQVSTDNVHTLVLLKSGEVVEFGGRCYIPARAEGNRAIEVASGACHSLLVLENGEVVAFGRNNRGQCTVPDLKGKKVGCATSSHQGTSTSRSDRLQAEFRSTRQSEGVGDVHYQLIEDFAKTVRPTKSVKAHFQEEVPVAFPDISREFLDYYLSGATAIASSRLDEKVTGDLEPMEVWALVAYTMDSRRSGLPGAGASQNFYHQLNKSLQKRDMAVIRLIQNYLHFLMQALQKVPCVLPDPGQEGRLLHRGVSSSQLDLIRQKYPLGQVIHWSGITSVSLDEHVAREFACEDGPGGILFKITARSARVVGSISAIPVEQEAILLPNFKACVTKGLAQKAGESSVLWELELVETQGGTYVF